MKPTNVLSVTSFTFLAAMGLTTVGCEDQGPAEEAGENLDEMGEDMEEGAEDLGNDMEEGMEDAENEME